MIDCENVKRRGQLFSSKTDKILAIVFLMCYNKKNSRELLQTIFNERYRDADKMHRCAQRLSERRLPNETGRGFVVRSCRKR